MKNILIVLLLFIGINIKSQDYLGLSQGNYAGALGIDFNPANVADNRMEMDLSVNGSFSFNNNYVYMNTQSMPNGWIASFTDTTPTCSCGNISFKC